jgi:hypothetical protein
MTEWYPDEQIRELATLPRSAPQRQALEIRLRLADVVEREYWLSFLTQTDQLYSALSNAAIPAGLEARLLGIADTPASISSRHSVVYRVAANWKWIAAVLLLGLALRNYLTWEPRLPREIPLKDAIAATISRDAIQVGQSGQSLEVSDNDPAKVQAALDAHHFAFPVMVLHPQGTASLLGGGTCDIQGTPAAYTRWRDNDGSMYTVFQFDGSHLGAPDDFKTTTQTPTNLWHGDSHYRVVIWSGKVGKCTWALVMDNDRATDMFSSSVY